MFSHMSNILDWEHERGWLGARGPFSEERSIAILPLLACCSSGLVVTVMVLRFPAHAGAMRLPSHVHELLALPMSILLAFRFENAYDRWWSSRHDIESLTSAALHLALCASINCDVSPNCCSEVESLGAKQQHADQIRRRILSLIDAYCAIAEECLHPSACSQRRRGLVDKWLPAEAVLGYKDADSLAKAPDRLLWCQDAIMECIHTGQNLEAYSAEQAGRMFETCGTMDQHLKNCVMVCEQASCGPFVVHLRTLLALFCYTFPFTLIGAFSPALLLPAQLSISFAYLGAEFCSTEMQDPFGNDVADIPTQRILQQLRVKVRCLKDKTSECGLS